MYNLSPYIKDNIEFLQKIAKTKSDKKKNSLILSATGDQILAILEIIFNVLKSNFALTKAQKRRLGKYAEYYRAIARTRTEKSTRQRIQQGGSGVALGVLLIPVLSALAQQLMEKVL